jgi:hypothetical protein
MGAVCIRGGDPRGPPFLSTLRVNTAGDVIGREIRGIVKGGRVNAEVEPKSQLTRQARDVGFCVT